MMITDEHKAYNMFVHQCMLRCVFVVVYFNTQKRQQPRTVAAASVETVYIHH